MIFNFYADRNDLSAMFSWLETVTPIIFVEECSLPDQENRIFENFAALNAHQEELDTVSFWPVNSGSRPIEKHVSFYPEVRKHLKASCRTVLTSPSLIRCHRVDTTRASSIGPIEMHYQTPKLAEVLNEFSKTQLEQMNWSEHDNTISMIRKKLRKTAVGNWKSMPVMNGIAKRLKEEEVATLWFWGAEGTIRPI